MRAILRWLFDAVLADAILGDLEEERRRRARTSPVPALAWYWRAGFGIAGYAMARRIYDAIAAVSRLPFGPSRGRHGSEIIQAARSLRRSPWYTATVVGLIALSMALATATFATVDGVLFKPLPYAAPDELYLGSGSYAKSPTQTPSLSPQEIEAWRTAAPELQISGVGFASTLGRTADLQELRAVGVTSEFFDVLGLRPTIGGFTSDDFTAVTEARPALISHGVWQRWLGGRPDVSGVMLPLESGRPVRVAGVLPPDFVFPGPNRQPDVLVPLRLDLPPFARSDRPGPAILKAVVRMPSTVSLVEVQTKLDAAMQAFADAAPPVRTAFGPRNRASLLPLEAELTQRSARMLAIVAAASGTLVLLACVSLAGLVLARLEDRSREMALRRAVGASGWTIARLQAIEVFLLAFAGTLLGVALCGPVLAATVRLLPDDLSLLKTPAVDLRVLLFAIGAACGTSLLIALWPATVATRMGLGPLLAGSGRSTKPPRAWARRVLVGGEVALALVLTVGGTLMAGSLALLWREDHGFSESDTVVIEFDVTGRDRVASQAETAELEAVIRSVPGVRTAGTFDASLLERSPDSDVSWRTPEGAGQSCLAGNKAGVRAGFFEALDLAPTAGRLLGPVEIEQGQPVAILSETAATLCWSTAGAVGRTITLQGRAFTIVGVVPDVRLTALDDENHAGQVYVPELTLLQRWSRTALVRTTRPPQVVARDLVAALRSVGLIDKVARVATMREALAESIRARRLNAWLFGAFAVAALAIVGVGILGLVAMVTARRTREFGIRYALGGTERDVLGMVVREQVTAVAGGVLAGALVAAWAGQFIAAYLYRFQASDPRLWTLAVATVVATALGGALIPAWRASRVDPARALSAE